ncbi:hypothetical protein LXL04_033303 [Taraxacum kok-saghyz]
MAQVPEPAPLSGSVTWGHWTLQADLPLLVKGRNWPQRNKKLRLLSSCAISPKQKEENRKMEASRQREIREIERSRDVEIEREIPRAGEIESHREQKGDSSRRNDANDGYMNEVHRQGYEVIDDTRRTNDDIIEVMAKKTHEENKKKCRNLIKAYLKLRGSCKRHAGRSFRVIRDPPGTAERSTDSPIFWGSSEDLSL